MPAENRIEIHPSLLQKLHRIHRQISDLTSQIARCPRQIQAGKAMVDEGSKVRDTAKETHKTAVLACDAKQLQLQSRQDLISEATTIYRMVVVKRAGTSNGHNTISSWRDTRR